MKIIHIPIFLIISLLPQLAHAGEFYLGSDLNNLQFKQTEFESTNVYSVMVGYEFSRWSVEGSYNVSKTDNKYFGGDQKVNMYHVYMAYRSEGSYYYKVKLGLTNERYKFSNNAGTTVLDDVHSGIARGLGVGYRYGQLSFELEYDWLGLSLDMIGLGVRYRFN